MQHGLLIFFTVSQVAENTKYMTELSFAAFGRGVALSDVESVPEVYVVQPTLMVIGLNHRTAQLAMRERFWISEKRRYDVLRQLKTADGIEEAVVLSTCCRTEFILWASEATEAASSLLQFLGNEYGLKLTEWERFYRLLDEAALMHVFRTAVGLDSLVVGETQITTHIRAAWEQARSVGASGRYLGTVLEKALSISQRVHRETAIGDVTVSVPTAALDLVRHVFRSLEGRKILLLGTGSVSELCAAEMMQHGAASTVVIDRSESGAQEVAARLGGTMAPLTDWWKSMLQADIVISATGCPHVVLTEQEAERIAVERNRVALVILDIAMPRDIDPAVQGVDGILLYDLEKIENALRGSYVEQRKTTVSEAEKIVAAEALTFRSKLRAAESAVPTVVALRKRLEEICRQELDSFIEQEGPFSREQDHSLHAVTAQVIQKIANSLARELKELPEREEQERMTAVVSRLFHLESPKTALAGANLEKKSERKKNERNQSTITVN